MNWNEDTTYSSDGINIKIKAVPAKHAKKKIFSRLIGNGNGYVLELIKDNSKLMIFYLVTIRM